MFLDVKSITVLVSFVVRALPGYGFCGGSGGGKEHTQKLLSNRWCQLDFPYTFDKAWLRCFMCSFNNWTCLGPQISPLPEWPGRDGDHRCAGCPAAPPHLKMKCCGCRKRWDFSIVLSPAPTAVKNEIKMPKESSWEKFTLLPLRPNGNSSGIHFIFFFLMAKALGCIL